LDTSPEYDIAIIGDGCASWMLLEAFSRQMGFADVRVLLIGSGEALNRTWCFWEADLPSPYQSMVQRSWSSMSFASDEVLHVQDLDDRSYHHLPGEHFFEYFNHQFLPQHTNIIRVNSRVEGIEGAPGNFTVRCGESSYRCKQLYNSGFMAQRPHIGIWQHFKGWVIELEEGQIEHEVVRLMDFNLTQEHGCAFMYILPYSATTALVEVTFFSPQLLHEAQYEQFLQDYIARAISKKYRIIDQEFGQIPMQQGAFAATGPNGEVNIGTLGGMVKASTGYAWQRIRADSEQLAQAYFTGQKTIRKHEKTRFGFYDSLMLWIIINEPHACKRVFTQLFKKKKLPLITRFMDEKTTLAEEISIFAVLPLGLFLKALWYRWCAPISRSYMLFVIL
jgi:lycopene beta-cyclase